MLHEALVALLRALGARPETPLLDAAAGDGQLALWLRQHYREVIINDAHGGMRSDVRAAPGDVELLDWAARKGAWLVTRPLLQPQDLPAALALMATIVREAHVSRNLNVVLVMPHGFDLAGAQTRFSTAAATPLPHFSLHVAPAHSRGYSLLCWRPFATARQTMVLQDDVVRQCLAGPGGFGHSLAGLLERQLLPAANAFGTPNVPPQAQTIPLVFTPSPTVPRPEMPRPSSTKSKISVFPDAFGKLFKAKEKPIDECPPKEKEVKFKKVKEEKPRKEEAPKKEIAFGRDAVSYGQVMALYSNAGAAWPGDKSSGDSDQMDLEDADDTLDIAQVLVSMKGR